MELAVYMETICDQWAQLWKQEGSVGQKEEAMIAADMEDLRAGVWRLRSTHGDGLGDMEVYHIDKAAAKAKPMTGLGVDHIRPADILDLPRRAEVELAALFPKSAKPAVHGQDCCA